MYKNSAKILSIASAILALVAARPAFAQADVTFSGGSGTPLTFTLDDPVSYTVTTAGGGSESPFFIFEDVGNPFNDAGAFVSGSISFTVDGGPSQEIDVVNSGVSAGVVDGNDLYFYSTAADTVFSVGDVVSLSGSWTTNEDVTSAAPASGEYVTFITDGNGNLLTANGTSGVPDVGSSIAMLAFAAAALIGLRRKIALG